MFSGETLSSLLEEASERLVASIQTCEEECVVSLESIAASVLVIAAVLLAQARSVGLVKDGDDDGIQ